MYKYKPMVSAENRDIIAIPFAVDAGNDDFVISVLERWLDDEAYSRHFPRENMYFEVSPDVDEVEVHVMSGSIVVRCFIAVTEIEDGDVDFIDSGEGLFVIRDEQIDTFTYDGSFN